ncbi:MAG: diphosphomevalonate decarboxylase [Gammaproteobacteria bacterium]|nr:diphosphomevalonate decarboxylase [Gammaproteobacteria bacterium]
MDQPQIKISTAANVALIKYWGKTSSEMNMPAVPSLSIGMEDLRTETIIRFSNTDDILHGSFNPKQKDRILGYLGETKKRYHVTRKLSIDTRNNFPSSTGLASSASGFAALAIGLNSFLDLGLSDEDISRLARRGSGSSARSVFGGYVEMLAGKDSFARPLMSAKSWPLDIIVMITDEKEKKVSSSEAMEISRRSSPFYSAWVDSHAEDFDGARQAILKKDFWELAKFSERNCLKMHATIMTSGPAIMYWNSATLAIIRHVNKIRESGTNVFFTIDAGPQVKLICDPGDTEKIVKEFEPINGIARKIITRVGGTPKIETRK